MVEEKDILTFIVGPEEIPWIRVRAIKASTGGKSQIREDDEERKAELHNDQMVGQIGQYVLSLWLTGGREAYIQSRNAADANPMKGDNGSDILGTNIDIKASRIRKEHIPLLNYTLIVRPREYHPGWVYILALVKKAKPAHHVYLIGWATAEMLLPSGTDSRFGDAHVLPARDLHPLLPIRWDIGMGG